MKTKKILSSKVHIFPIYVVLVFLFFILLSYGNISKAKYICGNSPGGLWYEQCLPLPPDLGFCTDLDGDTTGCATGWSCATPSCLVACDFDLAATCATVPPACLSKFDTCGCTCSGTTTGCAVPAGDADADGDDCDYDLGENMFNCPADCLPAGVPSKLIPDVIDSIISWLLTFAIAISVLVLVYGGTCYVFSSGDMQKTENAKKTVKYALLGIFIAGISFAIIIIIDMVFH
ncbi:MAG: hypothetical protein KAQ87_02185 [Candidatus Pacebacteria bacterium]|nr:hypothetical protein [Candidatus Paceibacterota bacterium]